MKRSTLAVIRFIVPILIFFLVIFQSFSQCSTSELQVEITYSTVTSTIEGDAIRLRNSASTAILYCQEFGTSDFTDTICIKENTPIEVYGYDIVNQNWGEATISFRYINNADDCGPTMDSTLLTDSVPLEGMGEMICGAPFDNDILIGSFTTPTVFCPGSEPQCPTDTIFLTTIPGDSTVIIDFLDFISDDEVLTFNTAFNQITDIGYDQMDTLSCGQVYEVLLGVTDDDGNMVSCDLVIEVECNLNCSQGIDLIDNDRITLFSDFFTFSEPTTGNYTFQIRYLSNYFVDSTIHNEGIGFLGFQGQSNWIVLQEMENDSIGIFVEPSNGAQYTLTFYRPDIYDDDYDEIIFKASDVSAFSTLTDIYINGDLLVQIPAAFNIFTFFIGLEGIVDEITLWDYELPDTANYSIGGVGLRNLYTGFNFESFDLGDPYENNMNIPEVPDVIQIGNFSSISLSGFLLDSCASNIVCVDDKFNRPFCSDSCQIAIFHSTQCNVINLNSALIDFEDSTQVTYQWTSSNTDFEATVADTVWTYDGELSEIILCLEVTDGNCTASTCDTVSVSQPLPPIIEGCTGSISLPYEENCSVIVDYQEPFAFDPCIMEQADVFCERSDGLELTDPFPLGTTEIICITTGISGLSDTCFTTIEVTDNIPPECIDRTWFATLNEFGQDTFVVQFMSKPAMDECSEVFFSNPEMIVPIDCFPPPGQTFQVEDESGNTSECLINFQILDPFAPQCVIQDQTIAAIAEEDSVQVFYEYEVEDNCPNPTVSFSIPDGSNFACGSEQEIFMYVEDNFGNADTCNFTLSIEECFDYFGSVCGSVFEDLNCNGVVDVEEGGLAGIQIGLYNPVDNDLLASVITDINGDYKVDTFPAISFVVRPFNIDGIYEVLAPAEDEYLAEIDTFETIGNLDFVLSYDGPTTATPLEEVCYQAGDTVVFSWKNDPCLPNANIMLYRSICSNEMFFSEVTGIENDGIYEYIIPADAPNQILEFALLGPGNIDFERYNCIEVHDLEVDFSFELIGCREYQFTATPGTYLGYQWTFGDNQGFMGLDNLSHTYSENGTYEVCLQVRTELGCETQICNEVTIDGECDDCNIAFEIEDIDCYEVGFTVNEENYQLSTNYQWTIDGQFQTEEREPSFDLGPGTYEVCLTSADAICSDQFCRTITKDTIFPELVNCLQGPVELFINENCDPVFFVPAVMEGFYCHPNDAGTPDVIYTRSDGQDVSAAYSMGTTTLTASFTDLYGVSSSCSFDIVVADDIPPVCQINTPVNFQLDQNGQLAIDPSMIDNGSFDNCGEVEISIEQTEFDCSDIGQFNMTFTASDGVNISTCTVEVTIEDGLAPFCSIETTEVFVDENGNIPLQLEDLSYTADDNCGIADIELLGTDIPCNETGPNGTEHEITMLVTDNNGLSSQCNTTILLRDTIAPECIDLEVFFEVTQIGQIALPFVDPNLFFDNCKIIGTINLNPEALCENIGSQIVDVKVNDSGGNQTICPVTFTYIDRIPPTCDIADLDIQATEENGAFVTFDGFAEDPCNDDIDITYSMESGALYQCGEYTITMTATDEHGNSSSCDFSLIVRDCDGCCLSESAFMDLTNQGFETEAMLNNQGNCEVQIFPPSLTDCQIISQVVWGDGTVMNGQFPSDIDFLHSYSDMGGYQICMTIEETDNGDCFSNQVCEDIEITSECQVITSVEEQLSNDDITLFPNPTSSILNISSKVGLDKVELLNLNGTRLISGSKTQIDMSSFPGGIYLLRISKGNNLITKKIIKI